MALLVLAVRLAVDWLSQQNRNLGLGLCMKLKVPLPRDAFDVAMDDGAIFHMRCYGDSDADVRLFISHGNGFAVDGYFPFWNSLADRFELIVFDFRNHGRNARSDPANHHYDQMAHDVGTIHNEVIGKLPKKWI